MPIAAAMQICLGCGARNANQFRRSLVERTLANKQANPKIIIEPVTSSMICHSSRELNERVGAPEVTENMEPSINPTRTVVRMATNA